MIINNLGLRVLNNLSWDEDKGISDNSESLEHRFPNLQLVSLSEQTTNLHLSFHVSIFLPTSSNMVLVEA